MMVLAILATVLAGFWTAFVFFANSMRSSPGDFVGVGTIIAAWAGVAALWLAWWLS